MGIVLTILWAGLSAAQPPTAENTVPVRRPSVCAPPADPRSLTGYKVPGRRPDSEVPWEMFLGNASHRLISYIYGTRHPSNIVFYNTKSIKHILTEQNLGNWRLLSETERELRPDITNATSQQVFEIKPSTESGLQDGLREIQVYLRALNRTVLDEDRFSAGKRFEGEILIQFAQGQYIWRLEWCTNAPGVTEYHWTRSQERSDSAPAAYQAAHWVEISEQELKRYGGWVAQAVEKMVDRRERLATVAGSVGVAIDIVGEVALVIISARQPQGADSHPTGKVLPFATKPSPAAPPTRRPMASGM